MAKWGGLAKGSTTAEGFETGFSRLRVRPSNRYAIATLCEQGFGLIQNCCTNRGPGFDHESAALRQFDVVSRVPPPGVQFVVNKMCITELSVQCCFVGIASTLKLVFVIHI